MSTFNSKIFSEINLARAKSKAIENRAAADGQSAIIGAWGRASASRNPLVPWKGDGWILRICITDALLATFVAARFVGTLDKSLFTDPFSSCKGLN